MGMHCSRWNVSNQVYLWPFLALTPWWNTNRLLCSSTNSKCLLTQTVLPYSDKNPCVSCSCKCAYNSYFRAACVSHTHPSVVVVLVLDAKGVRKCQYLTSWGRRYLMLREEKVLNWLYSWSKWEHGPILAPLESGVGEEHGETLHA